MFIFSLTLKRDAGKINIEVAALTIAGQSSRCLLQSVRRSARFSTSSE